LDNLKSSEMHMNGQSPPEVAFGPFQLDVRNRRLYKNGTAISLGERALDVLCALVAADGALVTKSELMAKVWPGVTVEENNLQVQVYAVRRALGEDGDSRGYVRTVSGRGYRFVSDAPAAGDPRTSALPAQEIRYCRMADGVHLALATLGEGSPVVRAPVWMSHVEHDWRTTIWREVLGALAGAHQLVRYDARGMGLSDRNVEVSFEAGVSDLETIVDALGLKRFALLGMSQGAAVSIAYAARHPDRVTRLVLAGGYARGSLVVTPERAVAVEAMATLVSEQWGSDNPAFRQLFTSLGFPDASAAQIHELNELQRVSASGDMAARILKMLANVDVSAHLAQVRAPTLVLHSRDDAWIPAERSREIARGIPGARFHEIAGANHIVLPQEPLFDSYIATVLAFIASD
jgi:pimeloyl-ACP methyl ester carboxylesterase/DNA-binding winged helix-turn-helix (wHTH) protein